MSDDWLLQTLETSQLILSSPIENALIGKLLDSIKTQGYAAKELLMAFAAGFDLLVATEYYRNITHTGWLYCPSVEPLLMYTYTNTCPRCVLEGRFEFHKANKPKSGVIGSATSRLLLLLIKELLQRKGLTIEVRKGSGPIDALFIDRTTNPVTVFFTEIKASPLVTLPLVVPAQPMITEESNEIVFVYEHRASDFPTLFGSSLAIFIPEFVHDRSLWNGQLYQLGIKQNKSDQTWAHKGVIDLFDDDSFFPCYFSFWKRAFFSYTERDVHPTYWFTNGCGQPFPRPETWPPRHAGTGYESVSDGKTSVGMDRTDDIKKGTYQVLILGAEGQKNTQYQYKVGMMSNIHAVRHFDDYLAPLKDIVWTRVNNVQIKTAGQLPPETELYNLFDGIITLTETLARDEWVENVFRFC